MKVIEKEESPFNIISFAKGYFRKPRYTVCKHDEGDMYSAYKVFYIEEKRGAIPYCWFRTKIAWIDERQDTVELCDNSYLEIIKDFVAAYERKEQALSVDNRS